MYSVVVGAMLLSVMMCWVAVAVKRYHTSSFTVPEHGDTASPEFVALCNVPAVCALHVRPALTGRFTAPAHSSLAGGGGGVLMQMLNVLVWPVVDVQVYTRT